jgi:D-alanine-D-alanine ligase
VFEGAPRALAEGRVAPRIGSKTLDFIPGHDTLALDVDLTGAGRNSRRIEQDAMNKDRWIGEGMRPLPTLMTEADGDSDEPPSPRRVRRVRPAPVAAPVRPLSRTTLDRSSEYQIAIPGFLTENRVEVRPRTRRTTRARDLSELNVVVLYNLALGLERGRPDDLVADEACGRVAETIASALDGRVKSVELAPVWDDLPDVLRRYQPREHMIFNLCESLGGRPMSESDVPRLLRSSGFIHTGASYLALRRTGSKLITKRTVAACGVSTPEFEVIRRPGQRPTRVRLPAIVKPVAEGGSFGVSLASVVTTARALAERVDDCIRTYHQPALVEEFIAGRELNVALWGNGFPEVLPISEILFTFTDNPLEKIVTFSGKWHPQSAECVGTPGVCPAPLTTEDQDRVEAAAILAFQKLGVRGFARVDIRLREGTPYVLEVNANPDLSPSAGFFRSARAAGHSYTSMVLHILRLALANAT